MKRQCRFGYEILCLLRKRFTKLKANFQGLCILYNEGLHSCCGTEWQKYALKLSGLCMKKHPKFGNSKWR